MKRNASPKAKIADLMQLAHPGATVEVRGTRVKGRFGGDYLTEASVNDRVLARARHRNWRKSYKMLEIEVSKATVF